MPSSEAATLTIAELTEFASFGWGEQDYITRRLDGLCQGGTADQRAEKVSGEELRLILEQGTWSSDLARFLGRLIDLSAYDLAQDQLGSFSAYRFLYERLLGPAARPWLPGAFCGAAALPQIDPASRKRLLQSISEAAVVAPSWTMRAPTFYPAWIEPELA